MPALPGSRSRRRSPTCSGSGSRRVSRAMHPGPSLPATGAIQQADMRGGPGRADVHGHVGGQARRHRGRQPDVGQAGHRPSARLDQGHAPGGKTGRDAAQVQRYPRHPADLVGRLVQRFEAPDPGRAHSRGKQQFLAGPDGPGGQRPGHHRAAAPDAERPVHPQPDRRGGVGHGQRGRQAGQRGPQVRQPGAGHRAHRDGFHLAQAGPGDMLQRLPGGRAGVGQIAAGHREQAVPDADRVDGGQMLGGLRHPAAVRGHHEQHGGDRADAGQHVRDEPLVAWHVDEGQPTAAGQRHPGEPEVDGEPAALFLSPPVRLHPGERPHERGLPVIHVPCGRDHLHGRVRSDHVPRLTAAPGPAQPGQRRRPAQGGSAQPGQAVPARTFPSISPAHSPVGARHAPERQRVLSRNTS